MSENQSERKGCGCFTAILWIFFWPFMLIYKLLQLFVKLLSGLFKIGGKAAVPILVVFAVIVVIAAMTGSPGDSSTPKTDGIKTRPSQKKETAFEEDEKDPGALFFIITGGSQGEYGKLITYNVGTEFEEEFYAYYVPAGTYEVKNARKYMAQVNVYSDEKTVNEDGWEEPAEVFVTKLIEPGETAEIVVGKGQHIEINDGEILQFKSINLED